MAHCSRREFLRRTSALALAGGLGSVPALSNRAGAAAAAAKSTLREYTRGGMRYRRLGQTDLFVSQLSFGSHIDPSYRDKGALNEEGQARRDRQVARAFDLGVNMIDTYENAGQWEPVARLAKPRRDKILVSVCRQYPTFVGDNIDKAAKLYGHVDLYRIYVGDADQVSDDNLEDWDALRKAKQAGKVRAIGISTHSEKMMISALKELEGIDYIMFPYNFIHARADYSVVLPLAMRQKVGLIAIKPLAAGSIVRLDPYAKGKSKPENANTNLYKTGRNSSLLPAVVAELAKGLEQLPGETLCQAALRFVYSRPFMTPAMPGMFQDHEVEANHGALQRHIELDRNEARERKVLDTARRLAKLHGREWLPQHYRWLDEKWSAGPQSA